MFRKNHWGQKVELTPNSWEQKEAAWTAVAHPERGEALSRGRVRTAALHPWGEKAHMAACAAAVASWHPQERHPTQWPSRAPCGRD